jgi:hypothetical protein
MSQSPGFEAHRGYRSEVHGRGRDAEPATGYLIPGLLRQFYCHVWVAAEAVAHVTATIKVIGHFLAALIDEDPTRALQDGVPCAIVIVARPI